MSAAPAVADSAVRSPAIVDGELVGTSASQLKTFAECERKWWLEVPQNRRGPTTPAQGLGIDVHKHLEVYIKTGHEPGALGDSPAARIARTALPHVPARGPDLLAEHPLEEPALTIKGVKVRGFIDLHHGPRAGAPMFVGDFKTTKSARYIRSAALLREDPQVVLYVRWAGERYAPGDPFAPVHVRFIYAFTGDGAGELPALPVNVPMVVRDTWAPWVRFEHAVDRMRELARERDPARVPTNLGACRNYGGCPHRAYCAANPEAKPAALVPAVRLVRSESTGAQVMATKGKAEEFFSELLPGNDNAEQPAAPAPAARGLELYVNALPVRGFDGERVTLLEEVVARHAAAICQSEEVADLALVPFGKGKGLLAAALRADPPRGIVVARSGPNVDVALEVLRPLAAVLVEGVR